MAATSIKSGGGVNVVGGDIRGNLKRFVSREVKMMDPHSLAQELHGCDESFLLLDCRPILAYNSCHIVGKDVHTSGNKCLSGSGGGGGSGMEGMGGDRRREGGGDRRGEGGSGMAWKTLHACVMY